MVDGPLGSGYLYDDGVQEVFTEQTWGHWPESHEKLRVLVVNPLGNWWSYAFTMEVSLRLADEGHEVFFLDAAPSRAGELEVNPGDKRSTWRFRRPQKRVASILNKRGITWVESLDEQGSPRSTWVPESLDELRSWSIDGKPSGQIVAAAISGILQERDFNPQEHEDLVSLHIDSYLRGSQAVGACIADLKPDMVATTNDRLLNAATALSEARHRGIESLVIYWGNTDTKCVTYAHSLYAADDWRAHIRGAWEAPVSSQRYVADAEMTLRAAGEKGLPATADFRTSMTDTSLPELPLGKKVLAFFPTTPWEYSGLVSRPAGHFLDQVQAVEALLADIDPNEWCVVVRHHPPRDGHRARPEAGIWDEVRQNPAVIEIAADSGVDSYQLMDAATVVAVWVSTIGAEAIARGKSLIVLGEPYWLNHDWGVGAPTSRDIRRLLGDPRSVAPRDLIPYLAYFHDYGSPLRHWSGRGPENLRVDGHRVFPRTLVGGIVGLVHRLKSS